MDLIKQQYLRIAQQLSDLTATQKMLVFSLVALMGLTLTLWLRFASSSEMVALFEAPLAQQELNGVTLTLGSRGIPFEVSGGRVMVPTERQQLATAVLAQEQMIPGNAMDAFEQMFSQVSPWESPSNFAEKTKQARNKWVAQTIRLWDGVSFATAQISPAERRGLREHIRPSASIAVKTKASQDPDRRRKMAVAISTLVSGLVPMSKGDIGIIIDGETVAMRDDSDSAMPGGTDIAEHQRRVEQQVATDVRDHFQEIAGLMVIVRAELNTKQTTETRKEVDPKNKIELARRTTSETIASTEGQSSQEPGVATNTGLTAPDSAPGSSSNNNSTKEDTENMVDYGTSQTTIVTPAGDFKIVGVSVRVPRSHFVGIWRKNQPLTTPPDKEPTDVELAPIETTALKDIRSSIVAVTNIVEEARTTVIAYTDVPANFGAGGDGLLLASASSGMSVYVSGYAREVAIAALAVVSLFMVTRMVKKSVPPPPVLPKKEQTGPMTLNGAAELAGIAGEGDNVLMGREIDDQVVAAKQMVEQVQSLVKDNPDAAATLVKRWLVRT